MDCFCLCRRLTCPALLGVYQQVYEVRHRVWSHRGQDINAAGRTTSDDVELVQSADGSEDQKERLEDKDHEKKNHEHWNDSQSEGHIHH